MKTNKFWSILVMLVVSVTAMVFTSCSSDEMEMVVVKTSMRKKSLAHGLVPQALIRRMDKP